MEELYQEALAHAEESRLCLQQAREVEHQKLIAAILASAPVAVRTAVKFGERSAMLYVGRADPQVLTEITTDKEMRYPYLCLDDSPLGKAVKPFRLFKTSSPYHLVLQW